VEMRRRRSMYKGKRFIVMGCGGEVVRRRL
jgi:hypothetical protein